MRCDRIIGYQRNGQALLEKPPLKILVIDDRWENRAVLLNLLETLGFRVIEAENGQAGLEQLRKQQPDLVITDLVMPVMDGGEFLRQVRSSDDLSQTKVIVSSASVSPADQKMAFDCGGDDFLAKPVDAQVLFNLLSTHLDLKWIYEAQAETPEVLEPLPNELTLSPTQTLETLLKLAQRANVRSLREQIDQLVAMDPGYTPFAKTILTLAKQFQTEEISALLQRYLGEARSHGR